MNNHNLENGKFSYGYTYCWHCGYIPKECLECECPCDIKEHDIDFINKTGDYSD